MRAATPTTPAMSESSLHLPPQMPTASPARQDSSQSSHPSSRFHRRRPTGSISSISGLAPPASSGSSRKRTSSSGQVTAMTRLPRLTSTASRPRATPHSLQPERSTRPLPWQTSSSMPSHRSRQRAMSQTPSSCLSLLRRRSGDSRMRAETTSTTSSPECSVRCR